MDRGLPDPPKKLHKQGSQTYLEQSLNLISNPQAAPVTISPGPNCNLSKVDLELADRLQRLRKKSNDNVPSEEEMAARLAELKGLPKDYYTKPSFTYQPPDNRTSVEKADDLISQMAAEVSLEAKCPNPDNELEERLTRLRGGTSTKEKISGGSQKSFILSGVDDNDDIDVKELVKLADHGEKQALKEVEELGHDAELAAVISEACKELKAKKAKKQHKRRALDPERFSDSDASNSSRETSVAEKEEIDRIVEMYKQKANLKKEKKKKRKMRMKKSDSDSSSSLSSEISTSESEKLSDDDLD